MTDITFIRHGQASIHSDNYDQLSDLGWRQARLLGEALKRQGYQANQVFHGSLRRQRETYEAIREAHPSLPKAEVHPGFNEFEHHELVLDRYTEEEFAEIRADRPRLRRVFTELVTHWVKGEIQGKAESFEQFSKRTQSALNQASTTGGQSLIVSSGGVIAHTVLRAMSAPDAEMISMTLQIANASLHQLVRDDQGDLKLKRFNHTPHYDQPEFADLRTYI